MPANTHSPFGDTPLRPARARPLVAALLAGLVVLSLCAGGYRMWAQQARTELQNQVLKEASQLRARMESVLQANLHLTKGLAAFVSTHPDLSQSEFSAFAERLLESDQHVVNNFTYAPGHVIRHVYPVQGNEAAIGLDLNTHPSFSLTVALINRSGASVIAGPHPLVQGGEALIVREPLFHEAPDTGNRSVWGQVSMPMDMNRYYALAGVDDFSRLFDLAIRGRDGKGALGDVFYGDNALFSSDPVLIEVSLPGGSWQIAARPQQGWHPALPAPALPGAVFIFLAVVFASFRMTRQGLLLRASESRVRETNTRLTTLLAAMPGLVVVIDQDGRIRGVYGGHGQQLPGPGRDRLTGHLIRDVFNDDKTAELAGMARAALKCGVLCNFEYSLAPGDLRETFRDSRRSVAWYRAAVVPLREEALGVDATLWVIDDITRARTAEKALRAAHDRYRQLTEAVQQLVFETDLDGIIHYINPAWERLSDYIPDSPIGRHWTGLLHGEDTAGLDKAFDDLLAGHTDVLHHDARLGTRAGIGARWISAHLVPCSNPQGELCGAIGTLFDITARKHSESEIRHQAFHDALTGLPNRMLLIERLNHAILTARRQGKVLALLYIDLDNFKPVNDRHGHLAGDQVLREVARRIRHHIRQADTAARIGGDEFIVLLESIDDVDGVSIVADKLLSALGEPIELQSRGLTIPCRIGASIGIAIASRDGADVDTLLQQADDALYAAKAAGKGCIAPGWSDRH